MLWQLNFPVENVFGLQILLMSIHQIIMAGKWQTPG